VQGDICSIENNKMQLDIKTHGGYM
jgi:hypothetical protein